MAFSSVEGPGMLAALAPVMSLAIALLFAGTLVWLARLNQRLSALRGAQSEMYGLLRACSDNVDSAEKSIAALRKAAQGMAADLGRSLDEAERLKADIDATCAAANRLLARLAEEPAVLEMKALRRAPEPAGVPTAPPRAKPLVARLAEPGEEESHAPAAQEPAPVEPRWTDRLRPPAPAASDGPSPGDRPAMRLFRDTIRAL